MCADQVTKAPKDEHRHSAYPQWLLGAGLVLAGGILTYAIQMQNWKLAQIASITGVILVTAGVARLAVALTAAAAQSQANSPLGSAQEADKQRETNRSMWLKRLVYVPAIGMAVITLYAIQYTRWTSAQVASTASVGYMAAGAAWLVGALLGFLFGIPHTRQGDTGAAKPASSAVPNAAGDSSSSDSDGRYEPSTSLEQISDWLTKIIVGVGLTQLAKIPGKLDQLAGYIASGMGDASTNKAFAMGIAIFFSVCGFLFGYLWARLYLIEAFRAADLKRVKEQISHQMRDLQAKDLIESHLDLTKPEVPVQVLRDAIQSASETAKAAIFDRAEEVRKEEKEGDNTQQIAIRTKPIFRALADADAADLFQENHALLGYVHQDLGEWEESIRELTKAIDIRNRLGRRGWKYFELKRAIARVHLESGNAGSPPEVRAQILADLREAYGDSKHIDKIHGDKDIQAWLARNGLSEADLVVR